jgi:hypothetical protein
MNPVVTSETGRQVTRRYLTSPKPIHFPTTRPVPETAVHMRLRTALFLIIERELRGRAFVGSDQFVYWDATDPKACLSPDVIVRLGGPLELLPSYKTWVHGAPQLGIEIVSRTDRRDKSLPKNLERYRRAGIAELARFDPEKSKPLRLWDFSDGKLAERDLTDPEARRCAALAAYWVVVNDATLGPMLRVARDSAGTDLWVTPDEAEQAASASRDAERAALEAERAAKDAALARIAELERQLRGKG